jgi:RNA polymerase primary sigma factor
MSDQVNRHNRSLVSAGRRDLAIVTSTNPLVSRGLADLATGSSLKVVEPISPDPNTDFESKLGAYLRAIIEAYEWAYTEKRIAHAPHFASYLDLETYLRAINEITLLTAAQETELANRIGDGDTAARDQMVRANLRLVVNIARGYTGKGLTLQELIGAGNLGLLPAAEGFDPTMNTRFSTYASYWIKHSIKKAIRESRIPPYLVELLDKWRRAKSRLTDALGRKPTHEEVAQLLGLTKESLRIVKKAIRLYRRSKTPSAKEVERDDLKHVMVLLGKMDKREATVLRMRFGLDDEEPKTLKEIGEYLGLTRERVRQIESEALQRLSENLCAD